MSKRHIELASQLRQVADLVENNPDLYEIFDYPLRRILVPVSPVSILSNTDPDFWIRKASGAGYEAKAEVKREGSEEHAGVEISFGSLTLYVYARKSELKGS